MEKRVLNLGRFRGILSWRIWLTAGTLLAAVIPASAQQQYVFPPGSSRPSVIVDLGVLEKLGPEPTLPGMLRSGLGPTAPAATATPSVTGGLLPPPAQPPKSQLTLPQGLTSRTAKPVQRAKAPPPPKPTVTPVRRPTVAAIPKPRKTVVPPSPSVAKPAPQKMRPASKPATPPPVPKRTVVAPPRPKPAVPKATARVAPPPPKPPVIPAAPALPKASPPRVAKAVPPPAVKKAAPPPAPKTSATTKLSRAVPPPPTAPKKATVSKPRPRSSVPPPPAAPRVSKPPQVASRVPPTDTAADGTIQIGFNPGSSDLPATAGGALDKLVAQMESNPDIRVQLHGFANGKSDSPSQARRMSLFRALSVRTYLMKKGVRSTRIDVRALGKQDDGNAADRVDVIIPKS